MWPVGPQAGLPSSEVLLPLLRTWLTGKRSFPKFFPTLGLLRFLLCREGFQFQSPGTSYVHHEPRIVSIFGQKPSLSNYVNQLTCCEEVGVQWSNSQNCPPPTSLFVGLRKNAFTIPPLSDYLFKLLLIGDSGVGKSCLLLR